MQLFVTKCRFHKKTKTIPCCSKLTLADDEMWDPEDQDSTHDLLRQNLDLFAPSDLDLGITNVVKCEINLKPGTRTIRDRYQWIPTRLYG